MKNDNNKSARNPNVQQPENSKQHVQEIKRASTASRASNSNGLNGYAGEKATQEELKAVALIARSWSGLLPPPEDFKAYPESAQNKIIEWNDAQILDETERQNELVRHVCRDSKRTAYLSFLTNILPIIAASILFVVTENTAAFLLLAVPCVTIGGNFVQIIIGNHKSDKSENK